MKTVAGVLTLETAEITAVANASRYYGSYLDTTTQTNLALATGINIAKLNTTIGQSGFTLVIGTIPFTSGGTTAISAGNTVTGGTSGATATVNVVGELFSGSWAGGDAVGVLFVTVVSGVFQAAEALLVSAVDRGTIGIIPKLDTIVIGNTGVYNLQYSAQVAKTDAGVDDIDIWLMIDGLNVAASLGRESLGGPSEEAIFTTIFTQSFTANQRVCLAWNSTDVDLSLTAFAAGTTPTTPVSPSIIVSIF